MPNRYAQRDEVLREMGYASYQEYLASPLWRSIRARLLKACDRCPCGEPATEIHHRTYKRRYLEGRGKIYSYLVPICRGCHESIEFVGDEKTALGHANARLDAIREEAEKKGIFARPKVPKRRRFAHKKKKRKGKKRKEASILRARAERKKQVSAAWSACEWSKK